MAQNTKLDIIVFGATGFTGKRTIPRLIELLKKEELSLTWGMAGRSLAKLKNVSLEMQEICGEDFSKLPLIQANMDNIGSLKGMTSKARIIINAVGPYMIYGERVIQACIETGTHHVDVSGEMQYMERMQLKYHDVAMQRGIYLISACGFECIPVDLGVVHLQKSFGGTLNSVETYLKVTHGGGGLYPGTIVNYTSYESVIGMVEHRKELERIRSKLHPRLLPQPKPRLSSKGLIFRNASLQKWCTIFPSPDRSVATRTQRYLYETRKQRPVQVKTYLCYDHFVQIIGIGIMLFIIVLVSIFDFTGRLLLKHPKFFTWGLASRDGPSEEQQAKTFYDLYLIGEGWRKTSKSLEKSGKSTDKRMTLRVSGQNPGYGSTGTMVSLAAIIILTESGKMPNSGGCYPPGAAFADTSMVEKLNKHGVKFELDV